MSHTQHHTTATTKASKVGIGALLASMGPGILTALAGNDAGGIATFSNAGSRYGFGQLWTIPITCILLIVVQETAARMSCATGKGFASLIREQFGIRISALAMLSLVITNTTVTISEFAGVAAGMQLFGVPLYVSVPLAALLVWMLTMGGSYKRIEKILLAISCVFVTYIVAGIMAGPDWGSAIAATFVPQPSGDPAYIGLLVATIGTTVSPYMMFMVGSNIVDKNLGPDDLPSQRVDNISGSIVAQLIAWFIVLTTATVLFPSGVVVESAEAAAQALVPIAGEYAGLLFALGLVGASFLAACVLPGVTANAVCEAFGWERGANSSWSEAPTYHGIIAATVALSAGVVMLPGADLFAIMMVAQVINGVLLPVLLLCMVGIASDTHVMGSYANSRLWNIVTWVMIVGVVVLTLVMFVLQAMGY